MKYIIALLLVSFSAWATAFEIRGNVRELMAGDVQSDNDVEHLFESEARLFFEGRHNWENFSLTGSMIARYTMAVPNKSYTNFDAYLYEAYGRWAKDSLSIAIGEQVVRWGVMEYVSPTDAINPRDVRNLIDPEVEDTYLPAPLIRLIFDKKPLMLEGIYQPFFRPSKYDLVGTDVSLFQPSFFALLGLPFPNLSNGNSNGLNEGLPSIIAPLPDDNPLLGEGGLRVGLSEHSFDFDLLFLTKRETFSAFDFPNGVADITPPGTGSLGAGNGTYPRNELIGSTARWVLENGLTLKGEALFQPNASVYDNQLFLYREGLLQWGAGLDYDWELEHFFTLEYAQDRVMSGNVTNYFLRDGVQHTLSAAAVLNFDAQIWSIELKGTSVINQHSYLLRPRVLYRPIPPLEIALGGNVWGGKANSTFGLLDANDQIFASAKFLF